VEQKRPFKHRVMNEQSNEFKNLGILYVDKAELMITDTVL